MAVVLAALVVMSVMMSQRSYADVWLPLVGGFGNVDFLSNKIVSTVLGFSTVGTILFSIYCLLRRTSAISYGGSVFLFLLLALANPSFLHFTPHLAVLLALVWVQFCFVEEQIFAAFLILSLASLFYAPAIWMVPVFMLLVSARGIQDGLRSIVKALSGFLVPYIYLLVFRWMRFADAGLFLNEYFEHMTDLHIFETPILFPKLFFVFYVSYLAIRASLYIYSTSAGKVTDELLKEQVRLSVVLLPFLFLFNTESQPVFTLMAYPVAILVSYYFKNSGNRRRAGVEMILLVMAVVINFLSYII